MVWDRVSTYVGLLLSSRYFSHHSRQKFTREVRDAPDLTLISDSSILSELWVGHGFLKPWFLGRKSMVFLLMSPHQYYTTGQVQAHHDLVWLMDAVLKTSPHTEVGSGRGVAGRGVADSSLSLSSGGQQSLLLNFKYPQSYWLWPTSWFVRSCPSFSLKSSSCILGTDPLPTPEKIRMLSYPLL